MIKSLIEIEYLDIIATTDVVEFDVDVDVAADASRPGTLLDAAAQNIRNAMRGRNSLK